jgi:hypothetical protein
MTLDEYAAAKEALLASLLRAILGLLLLLINPNITPSQWRNMLRSVYPIIKTHRDQVTELSRQFYDAHRAEHLPEAPRHDVYKDDHYPLEWFERDMDPIRERMPRYQTQEAAVQDMVGQIVKTVESGARRTLLRAVDSDPEAQGWARYDPRPPTCAFCTMMISRGPVYNSAKSGGGPKDNETMESLWRDNNTAAMNELMNRWHPKCTCIVIPVYDEDYESKEQEDAALVIYLKARKLAKSGDFKDILKAMRIVARDLRNQADEELNLPAAA